ncbi:putative Protein-S-isoprenylcysteine O-methyltransferase [Hypsibius exemplaris]|uniref:Protein-S-isoprenylcysteine O-methyltransferase n=1 Tax=Hypsibius exemplaris TaxID=2072580 RepID=A0A1W0WHU0_HYPEX|nr:putative Protein-S-isoprenylcysteine O-methyltransferase [Hypsibius exemplaris]
MIKEENMWLVDFARRWQPNSLICLGFFIPAVVGVYAWMSFLSADPATAHIATLVLSSTFIALQYFALPAAVSEISMRSSLLGHVVGLGLFIATARPYWMLGVYLIFLGWFHWSEYLFASLYCAHSCSKRSFILNHSPAYIVATLVSWLEFAVIQHMWPGFRHYSAISVLGLITCTVGETLRKLAISTAAESFNHVVEESKRKEHRLVTHGIYGFCRHPSYLGWWIFAVGTQVLLQNPVCAIAYFFGARAFFADRVEYEEELLIEFFGDRYREYCRRVPHRLPFVKDASSESH